MAASATDVALAAMPTEFTEMLRMHNVYRTKHQAPNIAWDDAVASRAATTVSGCKAEYSPQGDGQNLAYSSNPDLQLALNWTVNAW
jgi:hypothetical protein